MITLHAKCRGLPLATLTTALVVLAVFPSFQTLVYGREAIIAGEVWRLLTSHLVHIDPWHLVLNVIALLAVGSAVEINNRIAFIAVSLSSAVTISATVWFAEPDLAYYAGFSGILNGLFAWLCLQQYRDTRFFIWPLFLFAGAAKIAWESFAGPVVSPGLAWAPETTAHLAGFATGMVVYFVNQFRQQRTSWYFPWATCPFIP